RQVRIEFRTGNKELAGAMITQQGQLTMEASLREQPSLGIAVAGQPGIFLAVTAQDAAAFGEKWDTSTRMSAPNARRLASIWKALLQDYLTLFVAGQRPSQLAELSSRAKDLLAIFDESARLGAKGGIPIRVVYPPPSILARAVREMALYMPGESPQSTWTVLEGRWIGTIDLSGDARQVRIEFRTGNKELAGAMITQQGQLTMEASLREALSQGHFEQ
ncbi:MAG: hypothetical protein MUF51_04940, partial [Vicinamibacteria bacterium]|nr:hypothetical protein [Vicinamibacteria bacterium]